MHLLGVSKSSQMKNCKITTTLGNPMEISIRAALLFPGSLIEGKLDVKCPSVVCEYVLLPLVDKEAVLVNHQAE